MWTGIGRLRSRGPAARWTVTIDTKTARLTPTMERMTTVLAHVHKGLATVEEDGVVHTPRIFSVRIGFHDGFRHRQV